MAGQLDGSRLRLVEPAHGLWCTGHGRRFGQSWVEHGPAGRVGMATPGRGTVRHLGGPLRTYESREVLPRVVAQVVDPGLQVNDIKPIDQPSTALALPRHTRRSTSRPSGVNHFASARWMKFGRP